MWHLTAWKISVSHAFLNWIKTEMIFWHEMILATLIQRYEKKNHFILNQFKNERLTEILQAVKMSYFFFIVFIFLNLFWIIKCHFVRNVEPLTNFNLLCLQNLPHCRITRRNQNTHITVFTPLRKHAYSKYTEIFTSKKRKFSDEKFW